MRHKVRTYEELGKAVSSFAKGQLNLVIVIGHMGQAKTHTMKKAMGGKCLYISGGAMTAFKLYMLLYEYRDLPVVIDDVDGLYRNQQAISVLKALCQTEKTRTVSWHSTSARLEKDEIPTEFVTSSKVCIIANRWNDGVNADVKALENRGHVIQFQPSNKDIFEEGKKWFKDKDILKFIEQNMPYIETLSMRDLKLAAEAKAAGMDWKTALDETLGITVFKVMSEIRKNKDKYPVKEMGIIKEWTARTGMGRDAFFKYQKRFEAMEELQVPRLQIHEPKKAKVVGRMSKAKQSGKTKVAAKEGQGVRGRKSTPSKRMVV